MLFDLYRLTSLKEKSSIPIPEYDGRILVGVVDETNSLRYGQVFLQIRRSDGSKHIIQSRQVLITRSPAHFPGDVRKLNAVDCPALHHLDECVVFPTEGERPHPNEMSGGDTDGDEVRLLRVCSMYRHYSSILVLGLLERRTCPECDTGGLSCILRCSSKKQA